MVIKLKSLRKWQELKSDEMIVLHGNMRREIELNLNTEAPTSFAARDEDGVEYFLGVVDGLDTIIFSHAGKLEVTATTDAAVWFWTDDGRDTSRTLPEDAKLFVRPMTREQRSPAMDALAAKIQAKADRKFAMQELNNQALRAQLIKERDDAAAAAAQKLVDDAARAAEQDAGTEGTASGTTDTGAGEGAAGA